MVCCAIWNHLYNLRNAKNTPGCFSRFLSCTNGTKSHNASHIWNLIVVQTYKSWNSNKNRSILFDCLLLEANLLKLIYKFEYTKSGFCGIFCFNLISTCMTGFLSAKSLPKVLHRTTIFKTISWSPDLLLLFWGKSWLENCGNLL